MHRLRNVLLRLQIQWFHRPDRSHSINLSFLAGSSERKSAKFTLGIVFMIFFKKIVRFKVTKNKENRVIF